MDEAKQNRCRPLRVRSCLTVGCFVRLCTFGEVGSARLSQVVILTFDICMQSLGLLDFIEIPLTYMNNTKYWHIGKKSQLLICTKFDSDGMISQLFSELR